MSGNQKKYSVWKFNLIIILCILALITGGIGVYGVWRLGNRFQETEENVRIEADIAPTVTEQAAVSPKVTEAPKATEIPRVTEVPKTTETPKVTEVPKTTETPKVTEAPQAAETPKVTVAPPRVVGRYKVAIDAGHQQRGNSSEEPIGPGASATKAKVSSGTRGVETKVPEYVLNLEISLKLKEELLSRGYEVYMIRETHEVDISNSKRAKLAANAKADIFVRIHANGDNNADVNGALTMAPDAKNPYMDGSLVKASQRLSQKVINAYCAATGAKNRGVIKTNEMSGINWCTVPVTIVEMGFMTNPKEDVLMQEERYQKKIVKGIADGIDFYFKEV